jgi:hypothetical protein
MICLQSFAYVPPVGLLCAMCKIKSGLRARGDDVKCEATTNDNVPGGGAPLIVSIATRVRTSELCREGVNGNSQWKFKKCNP